LLLLIAQAGVAGLAAAYPEIPYLSSFLPTGRSEDFTDLTTTQIAGGLLDEFVRQYCAELEQLR
jgi:hypothetical protein